jgi:hypothetical protein
MPPPRRGRPTEQAEAVSTAVQLRLTPAERTALRALASARGETVARLLRRAVREIVTGGPDLFDDGLKLLSETARQLAAAGRNLNQIAATLNSGDYAYGSDIANANRELRIAVNDTQARYADLVRASRERWLSVTAGPPPGPTRQRSKSGDREADAAGERARS